MKPQAIAPRENPVSTTQRPSPPNRPQTSSTTRRRESAESSGLPQPFSAIAPAARSTKGTLTQMAPLPRVMP